MIYRKYFLSILLMYVFVQSTVNGTTSNPPKRISLDTIYQKAVDAFKEDRWADCITKFEESLHLNKLYNSVVTDCRLHCGNQAYETEFENNIDDLHVYDKFLKRTECLLKCQREGLAGINMESKVSDYVFDAMKKRRPYDYLQACYFQKLMLPKAASAAYTHLIANPTNKQSQENYDYLISQPEVDVNEVQDLEAEDYLLLYKQGLESYDSQNWSQTVASMEEVLSDYIYCEDKCRMQCEGPFDAGWYPDFITNIANHFAFVLRCKQKCQKVLTILDFDSAVQFLGHILNHLQMSYYNLDKIHSAARAAESYLLLIPNDEDMLANKKVYENLVEKESFSERPEIVHYYNRDIYEKKLLDYINNQFGGED